MACSDDAAKWHAISTFSTRRHQDITFIPPNPTHPWEVVVIGRAINASIIVNFFPFFFRFFAEPIYWKNCHLVGLLQAGIQPHCHFSTPMSRLRSSSFLEPNFHWGWAAITVPVRPVIAPAAGQTPAFYLEFRSCLSSIPCTVLCRSFPFTVILKLHLFISLLNGWR